MSKSLAFHLLVLVWALSLAAIDAVLFSLNAGIGFLGFLVLLVIFDKGAETMSLWF